MSHWYWYAIDVCPGCVCSLARLILTQLAELFFDVFEPSGNMGYMLVITHVGKAVYPVYPGQNCMPGLFL